MKLQQFNGGLHTRPRPQFIQVNQGVVYENIEEEAGSLKPVRLPKDSGIKAGLYSHYYVAGKHWISSDLPRDYVEFQKTLYWVDGVSAPQKVNAKGVQTNLGIVAPEMTATFTPTTNPDVVNDVSIKPTKVDNTQPGLPMELQIYVLVNVDKGAYSNALQVTVDTRDKVNIIAKSTANPVIQPKINSDTSASKRVVTISAVNGITIGSDGVQVYRQYKNKFYLVGSLANDTASLADTVEDISGNAELDYTKFGALQGVYQYVFTFVNNQDGAESAPSPLSTEQSLKDGGTVVITNLPKSSDPQVDKLRLYRVGGFLGEFTLVKELDITDTTFTDSIGDTKVKGTLLTTQNALPAPESLRYLRESYAMLFAAEGAKLRFTPIGRPNEWPASYYLQYDADITGIAPVANGILVFTLFRTYIVVGNGPSTLSTYLLSGDQGCVSNASIQFIGAEALWVSTDGVCTSSGAQPTVITRDRLGKLSLEPIDSAVYDGEYYVLDKSGIILCVSQTVAKHFRFEVESLEVANDKLYGFHNGTLWELFASDEPAKFKFKSALLTEGAFTLHKTYKKIFTYSAGHIIIKILINGQVVAERELQGEDSFNIQVPQELQRGFYIQFEVEGTGEVSELEYTIGE